MSNFNEQELLKEVKRYKIAVVVFNDMSTICYGLPKCKSIDSIDSLGILGVAFRDNKHYFYWFKHGEYYRAKPKEIKNDEMLRILHRSIRSKDNQLLKEVLEN